MKGAVILTACLIGPLLVGHCAFAAEKEKRLKPRPSPITIPPPAAMEQKESGLYTLCAFFKPQAPAATKNPAIDALDSAIAKTRAQNKLNLEQLMRMTAKIYEQSIGSGPGDLVLSDWATGLKEIPPKNSRNYASKVDKIAGQTYSNALSHVQQGSSAEQFLRHFLAMGRQLSGQSSQ